MAAKTGFVNASDLAIYIDSTLVSFSTNSAFDRSMDTREVTNKESEGNAEFRESKLSWTATGEHVFAPDATNGFYDLENAMLLREMVDIRVMFNENKNQMWEGKAYITSLSMAAPVEDNISFTVALQGTGKLTRKLDT